MDFTIKHNETLNTPFIYSDVAKIIRFLISNTLIPISKLMILPDFKEPTGLCIAAIMLIYA